MPAPEIYEVPIITQEGAQRNETGTIPYSDLLKFPKGTYVEIDPFLDKADNGDINVHAPDGTHGTIPAKDLFAALADGFKLKSEVQKENNINTLLASANPEKDVQQQKNTQGLYANIGKEYDFATQEEAQAAEDKKFKELQDKDTKDKLRAAGKVVLESSAALTGGLGPIFGQYILKEPNGPIKVIDPKDSTIKEIDKGQIADFANKNPGFRFYNPIDQEHWEAEKQFAKLYDPTLRQIQAGTNAAVNVATAGFVDLNTLGREGSLGIRQAVEKQEEDQYAKTQIVGGLFGLGVGLAASGGVGVFGEIAAAGKAAQGVKGFIAGPGAGLARQAAGFIGSKLVEGAVISAPSAVAKALIDEDLKGAAETVLLGSGMNLGFGLISKAAKGVVGKITAPATDIVEKLGTAENVLAKDLQATPETISRLGNPEQQKEFIDLLNKVTKNSTNKKEIINGLTEIAEGKHMQKTIGELDKFVDKEVKSGSTLLNIIKQETDKLAIEYGGRADELGVKFYQALGKAAGKDGTLTLPEIQKFVSKVGEDINYGKLANVEKEAFNQAKINVRNAALDELHKVGDMAVLKAPANVAKEWTQAKAASEIAGRLQSDLGQAATLGAEVFEKAQDMLVDFAAKKISNMVVPGIASMVAGPLGGIGARVVSKQVVQPAVKSVIADPMKKFLTELRANNDVIPSKLGGWLKKNAESPHLASYIVMDSMHALKAQVENIGKQFSNGLIKATTYEYAKPSKAPMAQMLGEDGSGLSRQQQFAKFANKLSALKADEALKARQLDALVGPFVDHPQLVQQMKTDLDNKIQYLHQIMPKNNNPPKPFVKNDKWQPTKAQLDEFENQLKVAQNPFILLDKLKNGKITAKEVATAAMLNPSILQTIRDRISLEAYSGRAGLTYQQRLNTSLLMGQAMDDSLKKVQQLQQTYGNQQPANAGGEVQTSGGRRGGSGGSKIKAADLPSSKATSAQRIAGK